LKRKKKKDNIVPIFLLLVGLMMENEGNKRKGRREKKWKIR